MMVPRFSRPALVLLAVFLPAPDPAGADSLTLRANQVVSGGATVATLSLSQAATATANFLVGVSGTNAAKSAERIQVASGQSKVDFPVTSAPTLSEQFADIVVTEPGSGRIVARARLTVTAPALVSLTLNKSETVGGTTGSTVGGTVTLQGTVPSPGLNVALGQSCSNCGSTGPLALPASVRVLGGAQTGTFSFEPQSVPSNKQFTVLASLANSVKTAPLTIHSLRPQSVVVSPSTIAGGQTATLTVQLNAPAYSSFEMLMNCSASLTVNLGTSFKPCPPPGVSVPLTLIVSTGQTSVSYPVRTQVTSPTQATILVRAVTTNGDAQTTVMVAP